LPLGILSKVFRGKFTAGLRRLHRKGQLRCQGYAADYQDPRSFSQLMRTVHRQPWVVYSKQAMGGPAQVLRYLGRYTHRVAISNHRLLAFDGERVMFRWKDYAHGGKQRIMKLQAHEFLRRFFLHVLPKGFVRIRHYGLLANRFRHQNIALARRLLADPEPQKSDTPTANHQQQNTLWHCPRCGAAMCVARRLTTREINSS
jgi:putative transposase